MEEIKIYIDKEKKQEVENLTLEKIPAGQKTIQTLYIENKISYTLDVEIELEGENVSIIKNVVEIRPKQIEKVELEFSPKLTTMKPLKAQLKINIKYVIT
jgi:hypothetical protein